MLTLDDSVCGGCADHHTTHIQFVDSSIFQARKTFDNTAHHIRSRCGFDPSFPSTYRLYLFLQRRFQCDTWYSLISLQLWFCAGLYLSSCPRFEFLPQHQFGIEFSNARGRNAGLLKISSNALSGFDHETLSRLGFEIPHRLRS